MANLNITPITANGTTQIFQTLATIGYQFAAFINGSGGAWNGASIAIQIYPDNVSQPITIGTLTQGSPFIQNLQILQGIYMQFVVTGATTGTSINLLYGPLGVYGI